MESIGGIDISMGYIIKLVACIFEAIIFDTFFGELLHRKYKYLIQNVGAYIIAISLIFVINSFENTILNFIANIVLYFVLVGVLFEGSLKEKIFYFIVFYTAFAGVEIIFEFILSFLLGKDYSWEIQTELFKLLVTCLEKLTTFVILFLIKKRINKEKYGMDNMLLLYSFILPIATFWVYSALFYSGSMIRISGISEIILIIGCILLLFSNALIFLMYDYVFHLNKEKQILEMASLKTSMEKKYYDRMEKVNIEQAHYMHDLKSLLRTIGNLALKDENAEIMSVIQDMKIRIGEMEDEFFCRNKVLNTILCEKKRETTDNDITFNAYVEPGVNLNFIQDIDIIIIMGNLVDNAIEASKKVEDGYIDINIFETQKGHFLVMRIENKFDGIVNKHGDNFNSTKDDPGKHGMGIRNIRSCIEKYNGFLQIDVEESVFIVSVVFTIL